MLDEHRQAQAGLACRRARALGRMRTSQERRPAAALHTLRLLPDLRLLTTSTSSTCSARRAFFAGEPAASRSGGAPGGAPRGRYRYSAGSSRQWSVARASRVRPARWPRWASPGRRAPSQPSCCGDTGALRALRFYFFLSHFDDTVLTGVAIRGQNGLLRYRDIAISPLMKALVPVHPIRITICMEAYENACGHGQQATLRRPRPFGTRDTSRTKAKVDETVLYPKP